MTHDELLAKIDRYAKGTSMLDGKAWAAVRAAVELHKPNENNQCPECEYYYIDEIKYCDYPCATIQAIEKELA